MSGGKDRKPMSPHFAVFNGHINDAHVRAVAALRKMKADQAADEIEAANNVGIMSIFDNDPTFTTSAYAALVAHFVNSEGACQSCAAPALARELAAATEWMIERQSDEYGPRENWPARERIEAQEAALALAEGTPP